MEFGLLGPVEARVEGRELQLGGPKQRALLALLLLHANDVVSRDRLIDGIWGDRPPSSAGHTLDNNISRLRKALGEPDRLIRRPPGYALRVEPGELDLDRFEELLRVGSQALADGDPAAAAAAQRAALELWRGPPLEDVLDAPFAGPESGRLEERRLLAIEERVEADLALGEGATLVAELEAMVREHPYRERPLRQLILALYRAGRQADALDAFAAGRRRLVEELGLEPGPGLVELQRKILHHDPALLGHGKSSGPSEADGGEERPARRTRAAVAAATVIVLAGVATAVVVATHGGGRASRPPAVAVKPQALAIDPSSGRPASTVSLREDPATMVSGDGSLWLAHPSAGAVTRVDLDSDTVADRVPVGGSPGAVVVGGGSVWVASVPEGGLSRLDPATGEVTQKIPLGVAVTALAFGAGGVWIADTTDRSLIELNPAAGTTIRTIALHVRPTTLALSGATMWVASYDANSVSEVDLRSGETVASISVGNGPSALAADGDSVWVVNALDSTVSRIDTRAGSVIATIPVGSGPSAVALADGFIWVANLSSRTVSKIDPMRNAVVDTARLGGEPTALTSAGGHLWVATRPPAEHRGGTLVLLHTRPISIDPARHVDLLPGVSDGLTRDGLVTYNHISGPKAIQLVPDLAIGLPTPTEEGRTYTFRLRPGIRYSDGRYVRAADFRRAIERLFRLGSDSRALFDGIQRAERCSSAKCDLSRGIVTDDAARTVTFHLRAPDSDFLKNLAEHGLATPVPNGTPFHDTGFRPIPGTGPYRIASASRREIRYVRNPFFREWSRAAQPNGNPDEIVMRFGLTPDEEVQAVREGRADWLADNVPARLLPALRRQVPSQLHSGVAIPTTDFFQLNTSLPPFADVRVRRALNFAIDRRAIVRIYGGNELAGPTCQILPPGVPGYRRYCPYARDPSPAGIRTAPDFARAQRLVAASGTRATPVTVWGWTDDPTISPRVIRYTADVLRRLGYPTKVRLVKHDSLAQASPGTLAKIQLIAAAWGDTPYGFFATWFACGGPNSHSFFCDPRIDRAILHARSMATNPRAAASLWAKLDRELVDRAAWVPLINERGIDFVSARVRNVQSHPYLGILADQLVLQ